MLIHRRITSIVLSCGTVALIATALATLALTEDSDCERPLATAALLVALVATSVQLRRLWSLYRDGERAEGRCHGVRESVRAHARTSTDPYAERQSFEEGSQGRAVLRASALAEVEHANRLKHEFLSTVSHELRTPLNAIVGWVCLIETGELSARETRQAVDAIDRNAHLLARLVEDLLDVSHLMRGRVRLDLVSCDLRALVEGVVATLRPAALAKQVDLVVQGDMPQVMMTADERRLNQVVWNLLSNAVKFTPRGGRIVADIRQHAGAVWLAIRDSGDGIDRAFLPYVFDAFRQAAARPARGGGLGVGLAIARYLIELHGGTVTAQSDGVGQGSVFTVSLPAQIAVRRSGPVAP
jgi:signal transduction histidine kinase